MPHPVILLVEDHPALAETIIVFLESEGFIVDYANNGSHAKNLIQQQTYDAFVLDVMLPDTDGYAICKLLRQQARLDTPILMLTARDRLSDKQQAFELGADDYLVKPFEYEELVMRLQALIRRSRGDTTANIYQIDDLWLDSDTLSVKRGNQPIQLSPIAFNILKILMRESPKVVSRSDIETELWGDELPDSDVLRSHVYTLRKAVDHPFDNALIQTIKGVGLKITDTKQT